MNKGLNRGKEENYVTGEGCPDSASVASHTASVRTLINK